MSKKFPTRIETLLLTILDRRGETLGVELRQGLPEVATVTVYTSLRRMRLRGWVSVIGSDQGDQRFRSYKIKEAGTKALRAGEDAYALVIEKPEAKPGKPGKPGKSSKP